ncbi:hypothetical protein LWI29_002899 [Acer saccharum]|uniref:PGG domain-containing protein n=1 Tax=Acer saccharum TaxID=4024 RepID=A0AA39W821_ACESA|nr:hypothetical protein LWI29_002899 [Acer saccharum]
MEMLLACDISAAYIGDKHRKMTPLHIAIGRGYIPNEIISRCLDCCELVDERRWNVLHFAMLSLNMEDLTILLKYPLIRNLINDKDVDGNTPLHLLAIFRSHLLPKIKDLVGDIKLDFRFRRSVDRGRRAVDNISHQKQEILKLEEPAGPYLHGVVIINKESGEESGEESGGRNRDKRNEEFKKIMEKAKESHLIVAALIATVTFTAAFTLPGGVIQDEGTAILSKKAAFQAFVITDAIAMVLSLSAVFAYFLMSLSGGAMTLTITMLCVPSITKQSAFLVTYGARSTMMAMGAMVIAFVTGTYAVLTTSLWLAILTTFIGLTFFLFMFLIWCGTVC